MPDRPGVLAGITQALGAERINIEDFELRHFSPERGGVLTMLVSGADEAERAAALLEAQGYGVSVSPGAGRMKIEPASSVQGGVAVPGDKSISHRAVLLGAVADGETVIEGFGRSADTESTIAAVRALGVEVGEGGDTVRVARRRACAACGRRTARSTAATPARSRGCSPGILAGQDGKRFELTGDESLQLAADGADRRAADADGRRGRDDRRPACRCAIDGAAAARRSAYELPVASAQVKSCVLLAGLYAADGPTTVVEPVPTRDHTERMLRAAGARVRAAPGRVEVWPAERLDPLRLDVPGDFSSAAPFVVAATLLPGSRLRHRRRRRQPDPHRPARRARADGRADLALQPHRRRAASRSPTSRSSTPSWSRPRSSRPRCRG